LRGHELLESGWQFYGIAGHSSSSIEDTHEPANQMIGAERARGQCWSGPNFWSSTRVRASPFRIRIIRL
jgi:hypothetical protein